MNGGGQNSQVGGDGHHLPLGGGDPVAHAGHVVAGGESPHPESGDLLLGALSGVQDMDRAARRQNSPGLQGLQGIFGPVDRQVMPLEEGGQALDVVAVLMGHQDAAAAGGLQPQLPQGAGGDPDPLAHIDQQVMAAAADHAAIARGTGIKRDEFCHQE